MERSESSTTESSTTASEIERKKRNTSCPVGRFDVLFDKLGWWNEIVERSFSENQIKLERVYVRMPRH